MNPVAPSRDPFVEAVRYSHYISRDWGIVHKSKTPSKEEIVNVIVPRIASRIGYYDSVYVTQIPHVPENIETTYTVTGEMFLIFLFFSEKKEFSMATGLKYEPEGENIIKYFGSMYTPIRR